MNNYERDPAELERLFKLCIKHGTPFEQEVGRTVYYKQKTWASPKQMQILCDGATYKAPATGWMRNADRGDYSESDYEIGDYENCAGWHK